MGLELKNIYKRSEGYETLRGLNMTVEDDTYLALIAPTGTGKTTLLRVIAGIDKPDGGQIFVDGEDVTGVHVRDRNIAMVYQQFINYPSLTVYENIASPLRVAGVASGELDRRVQETAEILQISDLLDRLPEELSGGQQQRVAIARAVVKDARLILLDEPLGNLDYKLREDLRLELKDLAAERDAIFIYATPEPIDALTMASHSAILHDGDIIQYGPTKKVYQQPCHSKSGEYFSEPPMNFFQAQAQGDSLTLADNLSVPMRELEVDLSAGDYLIGVRPHHLTIDTNKKSDIHVTASVELAEVVGSEITLHVEAEGTDLGFIVHSQEFARYGLGQQIRVNFHPRRMHIFDATTGDLIASAAEVRE